jgi:hypothetical protein
MVSWRDVIDQEVRREELMRQAQQWRMVEMARAGRPTWSARLAALMIRLGAWMERTGCRLQSRFAEIEASHVINAPGTEPQMNGCS